ncbi:TPA: rhodanese-like domain-containing protein [Candidatus Woesearchaeota archaeon]|nr:rhodanese-like domain-containing protein [Candidatus Woesearchaeota archaeon]
MNNGQSVLVLAGALILGLLGGILGAVVSDKALHPSEEDLITEFYDVENAVHVSPHSLRKMMEKGDSSYVLVDLRSAQEYEKEHIAGAVSIPAYKDPDTSAYGDIERIVGGFEELPKDKGTIVYCYSMPCMTGRKIGKMLAERGIYVKHLGIGWNEWRYQWTLWNHEHEWNLTRAEDYIVSGKEPGAPKKAASKACPIEGEFGC